MNQKQETNWTVLKVLNWTAQRFSEKGFSAARLEAEVLLAHSLAVPRIKLYTDFDKPMDKLELGRFRELVKRRLSFEPLAYITQKREFWSLSLEMNRKVLIPRPETELLVEVVLEIARRKEPAAIVDVGTGSGAIAIALKHELKSMRVIASDIDEGALDLARQNAEKHQLVIEFFKGDLLEPLPEEAVIDIVVANLPYVTKAEFEALDDGVKLWEPRLALDGGDDGLDVIRRLVYQAVRRLGPGGWIALEVGWRQAMTVKELLAQSDFVDISVHKDLAGVERVVTARV